jgi:uncharacterized protein with NRDE domain
MCLILLAVDSHPRYSLVVAANRDEYYARPTRPLQQWPEAPQLWAGQDLNAGGTWLGLTRSGRFAAVTNARDIEVPTQPRSRGRLPLDFLQGDTTPADYARRVAQDGAHYAGFNLLVGDPTGMYYCSNGEPAMRGPRRLEPGIYGVANASLDSPWPKVESGKADLRALLENAELAPQALLDLIKTPADTAMPLAGLSMEATTEYLQATRFISSTTYGTRASTALLVERNGAVALWEQNFSSGGHAEQLSQFHWQLNARSVS